ncbi:hypothetical protein MGN70_004319 [Eutypa lata]|nr:hypothetical protein MGN70_004319 [Eutypa lata]
MKAVGGFGFGEEGEEEEVNIKPNKWKTADRLRAECHRSRVVAFKCHARAVNHRSHDGPFAHFAFTWVTNEVSYTLSSSLPAPPPPIPPRPTTVPTTTIADRPTRVPLRLQSGPCLRRLPVRMTQVARSWVAPGEPVSPEEAFL